MDLPLMDRRNLSDHQVREAECCCVWKHRNLVHRAFQPTQGYTSRVGSWTNILEIELNRIQTDENVYVVLDQVAKESWVLDLLELRDLHFCGNYTHHRDHASLAPKTSTPHEAFHFLVQVQ